MNVLWSLKSVATTRTAKILRFPMCGILCPKGNNRIHNKIPTTTTIT
ncbi:hypothetical protein DOY81_006607 [Sarcophaga bullata]|nr:hypothetical protein DOY81_006607 [Sarcophaga bullata]